jgi:sugar phosphate isomerase/epimerase
MRWALNQITIAGGSRQPPADLPRDLHALRAGGWGAIELWLPHWEGYVGAHGLPAARRLLDESGLVAAGACGGAPFFFAEGAALRQALDLLRMRLEQCQALGAPHMVVAPGFAEPAEPSAAMLDRAAENVRRAGQLAAQYGVGLGIECLARARLVRSLPAAIALARRALAGAAAPEQSATAAERRLRAPAPAPQERQARTARWRSAAVLQRLSARWRARSVAPAPRVARGLAS